MVVPGYLVEVGCRGFPAQSVWKFLTAVGLTGRERKKLSAKTGGGGRESLMLDMEQERGVELAARNE